MNVDQSHPLHNQPVAPVPLLILGQRLILHGVGLFSFLLSLLWCSYTARVQAQSAPLEGLPLPQDTVIPQVPAPAEQLPPQQLPPADELLGPPQALPSDPAVPPTGETFPIERFEFINNTAFDDATLQSVTADFIGADQTFTDIAKARAAVTQLYIDQGYATSGAVVPPQQVIDGVVQIEIVEGRVSDIVLRGTHRLRPSYISSRIGLGTSSPLNVNTLVERLQLLQLDPLVTSISADLQASPSPGENRLVVSVMEADSFGMTYTLDNNRSPSVGTVRNQLRITEANLTGLGDSLSLGYTVTGGSDGIAADYSIPLSPRGSRLKLAVNRSDNDVVEEPFDALAIDSDAGFYELTLEHPLWLTPTQELTIGLTASHQRSQTSLGIDNIGPTPLALGADSQGRTRVSAMRFFQAWTDRSPAELLALRSQFNLGLDALDATINDGNLPDSRFFSWQGQAQWLRVLSPNTLLLLRGSAQLATDPLLSLEQLSMGGQSTVRGYRQNLLSTDSGVIASAEVRFPLWKNSNNNSLLQITPFVDMGYGWNVDGNNPDPLASLGTGLLFSQQDITARLDWGIPLISVGDNRESLQEMGLYFTLKYSFL